MGDADDEELLAGSSEGYVELAVEGVGAVGTRCGGLYYQLHLVGGGDGGAVDDDVALAALVALYGIDADMLGKLVDAERG